MSLLPQAVDILQNDDCRVDDHADGEGDAGKRNDIDRLAEGGHGDERGNDRGRDCQRNDQGRPRRAQEQQQDEHSDRAADPYVLQHEIDRGSDIGRLVIHLFQHQSLLGDRTGVELRERLFDLLHGADDIDAYLVADAEIDDPPAVHARPGTAFAVLEGDVGDIGDHHARDTAGHGVAAAAQNDPFDFLW